MLDQSAQARRKIGNAGELLAYDAERDDHMAEQLAFGGVAKTAIVAQLVDLADIVQHGTGEEKIEIHAVMRRGVPAQLAEREHVLKQPAKPRVVNLLGGRSFAVAGGDIRIVKNRRYQSPDMRIDNTRD